MPPIKWQIGCSGFHYREWKGNFYPIGLPQKEWFNFYAERFNTLELNSTFYQFPRIESLKRWYNTSPGDFVFAIKAPRLITHYKKFTMCSSLLNDFYSSIRAGLKEKLGPVLFQLPPKFCYTEERLELIIEGLSNEFTNVIEFRDQSWWLPKVFKRLRKDKISFCGAEYPGLPDTPVMTSKTAYYRFHGRPRLYYSAYKRRELKNIIDTMAENKTISTAYIFFNNTATAAAIKNADWLKNYIKP